MKVSDCCGAEPIENSEDLGICVECKEHCEYVKETGEEQNKEAMTKKEAFKYWGTMNGWNDETSKQFRIAQKLHDEDQEQNPDDHQYAPTNYQQSSRGYNDSRCKCGFGYYVDSSG